MVLRRAVSAGEVSRGGDPPRGHLAIPLSLQNSLTHTYLIDCNALRSQKKWMLMMMRMMARVMTYCHTPQNSSTSLDLRKTVVRSPHGWDVRTDDGV